MTLKKNIYLNVQKKVQMFWFSWTVQRGLHYSFSHEIFEKKALQNIYVIFTCFQFKIIYVSTFGQFFVVSGFFCLWLLKHW